MRDRGHLIVGTIGQSGASAFDPHAFQHALSGPAYVEIIRDLFRRGAQGAILGCTEIPLLVKEKDSPVPVFDTTALHAAAAVDFALGCIASVIVIAR